MVELRSFRLDETLLGAKDEGDLAHNKTEEAYRWRQSPVEVGSKYVKKEYPNSIS